MERITIIGLGPIGLSIGLALKKTGLSNTEIIGTGGDRELVNTSKKIGAVDEGVFNMRSAIEGAQLIILDLPLSETRQILDTIGLAIEDGAVVTDTGTSKVRMIDWAKELLPKGVNYVGGNPLIKELLKSQEEANGDVFKGINYCVVPSPEADDQSVKTVVGLVEAVGARPVFLDPHEHDSYTVAMNSLPLVTSCAFTTATAKSESWREMHRLAASDFGEFSRYASNDPEENETDCLANPDALVHWIDQLIRELYDYRNLIMEGSEDLLDKFVDAWEQRARWETGVIETDPRTSVPSSREAMASAFFGERLVKRYQQATSKDDKKDSWKYERRS